MPIVESEFRSPWWMLGGHLQTQLPVLLRWQFPLGDPVFIPTRDNDQLSARFYSSSTAPKRLIILSHGLEGSNRQHYILGMIDYCLKNNIAGVQSDFLAWNLRGCGSPNNKTHKLYFAGCIKDLDDVVVWAEQKGYAEIVLMGYSLGGNITLRWLGEQGANAISRKIKAVCTASSTVDLASSVKKLDRLGNVFYRLFFVFSMKRRLKKKAKKFPDQIDLTSFDRVNSFQSYDEFYSAPLNGFANTDELYLASSAVYQLANIQVPCLMVQAENDPFLAANSFPKEIAENNPQLTLEVCQSGGHVGFLSNRYEWYLDRRFVAFLNQVLSV
jgi:uncharacterized protein